MANYLYNGVELPALPEWDKTVYPYAVIYCGSGGSVYLFDVCSERPIRYLNGNNYSVGCPNGCQSLYFGINSTLWNNGQPYSVNDHYSRTWTDKNYPLWANIDILDEDGTVYLAASDPVEPNAPTTAEAPTFTSDISGEYTYTQGDTADTLSVTAEVSDGGTITYQWFMDDAEISGETSSSYTPATGTVGSRTYFCRATNTLESGLVAAADSNAVTVKVNFDLRSFLIGLIAALVSTPVRVVRKIVGYLYNGVQLPDINTVWDKETYPYVFIRFTNETERYAWFSSVPFVGIDSKYASPSTNGVAVRYTSGTLSSLTEWTLVQYQDALVDKQYNVMENMFWSNYDILNSDGTVHLAASEPVPVYE